LVFPIQEYIENQEAAIAAMGNRLDSYEAERKLKPHVRLLRWLGGLRFGGS
jgi:hypothetical protein